MVLTSCLVAARTFFAAAFFFPLLSIVIVVAVDDDRSLVVWVIRLGIRSDEDDEIFSIANPFVVDNVDSDPATQRCAAAATTSQRLWSISDDLVVSSSDIVRPRAHRDMATSSTPGSVMVCRFVDSLVMVRLFYVRMFFFLLFYVTLHSTTHSKFSLFRVIFAFAVASLATDHLSNGFQPVPKF